MPEPEIIPSRTSARCGRCHKMAYGKVFFIRPNPSLSYHAAPDAPAMSRPLEPTVVCGPCLTEDEIALLLAPVAYFVIDTLIKSTHGDAAHALYGAHQYLKYRQYSHRLDCGEDALDAAKKALGI